MALLLGVIGVMAIHCFFFNEVAGGVIRFGWGFYFVNCGGHGAHCGWPVKFLKLLSVVLLRFSGRIGVLGRRLGAGRIRWS